jgi:type II secretion system protein G
MKYQRGFTLLEMMVVVAIIAILAAVLIPNFTHARAQAATSACMANMKTIATAMELYYTDNQAYPVVSLKPVNQVPGLATYMGNQNPVDPAGAGSYEVTAAKSASGVWTYDIWCPGAHDPTTLKQIEPTGNTTNATIKYDNVAGMTTASAQGN